MHFIHRLHQHYGSIVRISPNEISVSDPDTFRTIHRLGKGFLKSEWYARFTSSPTLGIFDTIDAKKHAARRRLYSKAFSESEVRGVWEGMVRGKVEFAMLRMEEDMKGRENGKGEGEVDVLRWLFYLTTDVSGHLMFGESFRTLEEGKVCIPAFFDSCYWSFWRLEIFCLIVD
jgi:cytochrome P450